MRTEDGSPISVQANISSINWGEQPAAMLCFEETPAVPPSVGVSEEDEKIAELEAILDTATDGVLVLDRDGCILRMNHSAEALFEVDRHKVAGERFISLLANESHKDALAYLERFAQQRPCKLAQWRTGSHRAIAFGRSHPACNDHGARIHSRNEPFLCCIARCNGLEAHAGGTAHPKAARGRCQQEKIGVSGQGQP